MTQFWNSKNQCSQLHLLIETANPRLVTALKKMSFRPSGKSNIGEDFYKTNLVEWDARAPVGLAQLKETLRAIESVPVEVGTAPAPADWYYK